jgi:molecular chaperone DnaK (HSP70)
LEQVNRSFAKNYAPSTFQYCLTVPAMWSDRAKNYMRQAAVKAGLVNADDHQDRLVLISEPEAAALYCERMCDQVQLEQGHRMMICDAGGGTVDLITFEILSVNKKGGSRLKEITKGSGKSCGSTFLDLNFKRFIEKKLDHQVDKLTPSAWSQLMDQFVDHIKPEFDGEEDHILNLPASIDVDELDEIIEHELLDEHTLTLSGKELKEEVFDPIIHSVVGFFFHINSKDGDDFLC